MDEVQSTSRAPHVYKTKAMSYHDAVNTVRKMRGQPDIVKARLEPTRTNPDNFVVVYERA